MDDAPHPSDRLLFVPLTVESCRAGLVSNKALSLVIDADVPPAWPPRSLDRDTVSEFMVLLHSPERRGLSAFYWLKKPEKCDETPVLVGSGGFIFLPDGGCELGYSVVPPFLNQGFATEAVRALLAWIFSDDTLGEVTARTFPDNPGSIRVLVKNGFHPPDPGEQNGIITYRITREDLPRVQFPFISP